MKDGFSSSSSSFTVSIIISDTLTSIIQGFFVTYQEAGTFDQAGEFPQALCRGEGPLALSHHIKSVRLHDNTFITINQIVVFQCLFTLVGQGEPPC